MHLFCRKRRREPSPLSLAPPASRRRGLVESADVKLALATQPVGRAVSSVQNLACIPQSVGLEQSGSHRTGEFWKVAIEAIYRRRNPRKLELGEVSRLLSKYQGKEAHLYLRVCQQYDLDWRRLYVTEEAWSFEDMDQGGPKDVASDVPDVHKGLNARAVDASLQLVCPRNDLDCIAKTARACNARLSGSPVSKDGKLGTTASSAPDKNELQRLSSKTVPKVDDGHIFVTKDNFWRAQLEAIYRRRNQFKMPEIPQMLARYKGREAELYVRVCHRYDLDPGTFYTYPGAWAFEDEEDEHLDGPSSIVKGRLSILGTPLRSPFQW